MTSPILTDYWLRVTLPWACGGIRVVEGTVSETPPIFKWMIGKPIDIVGKWVQKKNGFMEFFV